jgi:hypothetical protein
MTYSKYLRSYNLFYNAECASMPHGGPISSEEMQAMTLEALLSAAAREDDRFDAIPTSQIRSLAEALIDQGINQRISSADQARENLLQYYRSLKQP